MMTRKTIATALFTTVLVLEPISSLTGGTISDSVNLGHMAWAETAVKDSEQTTAKLDKEDIYEKMNEFIELLHQPTDRSGAVLHINNKNDLVKQFETIAKPDAVRPFIDELYQESDGKLYVNPIEMPPSFDKEADYDMLQVTKNKIEVIQQDQSDFYGNYTIKIEFIHEGTWKISSINYE